MTGFTWADALQWGVTAFIALAVALAVTIPKGRAEAKDIGASAFDKLTDAQIDRQINAITSAEEETRRAKEACNECRDELQGVNRRLAARDEATDALIDAVLEFLRLIPEASAEATLPVRNAITTARRARHNYRDE